MTDLFDPTISESLKEGGIALAAASKGELLAFARELAVRIALSRSTRECTADDVQQRLYELGISVHALGNAAGALFRGDHWRWTGRWEKSARRHAHANPLRVWEYVGS